MLGDAIASNNKKDVGGWVGVTGEEVQVGKQWKIVVPIKWSLR